MPTVGGRNRAGLEPKASTGWLALECCVLSSGGGEGSRLALGSSPPPQGSVASSWDVAVTEQEVTQPGAWWQHAHRDLAVKAGVRPQPHPRGTGDQSPSQGLVRPHLFREEILFAVVN